MTHRMWRRAPNRRGRLLAQGQGRACVPALQPQPAFYGACAVSVDHHPLVKDFPEFRERIHSLKHDAHFARLSREYEALDKEIVRLEDGVEQAGDSALEGLKKQRLAMKDQLYALLKS
jgi:uncharacterized protein YdcH (DUF465 family)